MIITNIMGLIYGSKAEVYHGNADCTRGSKLFKKDIVRINDGYGNFRYKSKKQQKAGHKQNSFRAKWAKAMKKARKELGLEGFVPVGGKSKEGKALLKRIREIMDDR
jgi:hypothetical protein